MNELRYIAVLSDIHGNLQALQAVVQDMQKFDISGVVLLGDLIDYGMQSNEVVWYLRENIRCPILCNIWGNHERAILLEDFTRFSSERGEKSARRTSKVLGKAEKEYLCGKLNRDGFQEFDLCGKKCLAVHGSLEDVFWKSVFPENVHGNYEPYDIVFSGHSHYSHVFSKFYDSDDPSMRNKHAVLFINPGSVGQPRNHHSQAQYAILDIETLSVNMRSVPYDVEKAQSYFDGSVDEFYRDRLTNGI